MHIGRPLALLIGLSVKLTAGGIYALPSQQCGAASAAQWETWAGAGGCALGSSGFAVYNFNFQTLVAATKPGSSTATDANVLVTPDLDTFNLNFGSVANQDVFKLASLDYALYQIRYTIDPPPPIMPGFDLALDVNSPQGGGTARIIASVCASDTNTGAPGFNTGSGCTDGGPLYTTQVLYNSFASGPPTVIANSRVFFNAPANLIDVILTVELSTRNGGTSQITGFDAAPQIPEPGPFGLVAAGLGLVLLGRRRG